MKLTYKIITGAAAALSLAAAGAVYAQQGGGMGYGMAGGMAGADRGTMAASRLAELKAELKITPTQEPTWLAFENQIKQQSAAMQATRSQMQAQMQNQQLGAASTNRVAQRDAMMKLRDANQAAHSAAMKDLYAVLTPEQKAIADQRLNAMSGRHFAQNRLAK